MGALLSWEKPDEIFRFGSSQVPMSLNSYCLKGRETV
jgi:hypothetical protein